MFGNLAGWFRRLNPIRTHPVPPPDPRISKLKTLGCVYPELTLRAVLLAGIGDLLPVFQAILEEESSGGYMVWGHDPDSNFIGGYDRRTGTHWGELVTHQSYAAYKAQRVEGGAQGCGSGQLTSPVLQDQADALGGCWRPQQNLEVAARFFAGNVRRDGLRAAVEAYNGSGPAAVAYADRVLARAAEYRKALA